jgi:hypothetical protein
VRKARSNGWRSRNRRLTRCISDPACAVAPTEIGVDRHRDIHAGIIQSGQREAVVTLLELGADPLTLHNLHGGNTLGWARDGGPNTSPTYSNNRPLPCQCQCVSVMAG